ncbi:MAG TPA: hypothetical protein VEY88_22730, partial [Archangium sp.]|nr:hypothetical protein [Archangium sp.]
SDLLAEEVIPLLDVEPGLYGALDALTRGRTLATLRNAIGRLSVKRVLTELRKREILTADESTLVSSSFESESMPLGVALALDWPEVHRSRILVVLSEAGSSWRLTSAKAIDTIQNLSDEYAARFTEGERARYVLEVARGASWEASQLVSGGLGARRDFLDDFGRHLNNVPADMLSVRTSWTSVIRMLLASDRPDLVRACLSLWEHPDAGELKLDDEVFAIIEAQGDPELRQAAKDFLKRKKRDDGAGT